MKQIVAIVGRPNVGKSTLFNNLTSTRNALVADRPGMTRDRQYGVAHHNSNSFLVIDTGGIGEKNDGDKEILKLITKQTMVAASEASLLVWMVDGRTGLTNIDEILASELRKLNKPIFLVINKLEGDLSSSVINDFYKLGLESIWPISSKRGDGIDSLLDAITKKLPPPIEDKLEEKENTRVSILGKPNVGKSTLINKIIGEDRLLTFNEPGTTRDSIEVKITRNGKNFVLIDTAGIRRKNKVNDTVEKFSVLKSLEAIESANIIILVIDGKEGVTEQDSRLLGMIQDSGKSVIIAVNKWDSIEKEEADRVKSELNRKFSFIDYAEYHYISALNGIGINNLFKKINAIKKSTDINFTTSHLTKMMEEAVLKHPPKIINGRRIKLRYMHLGTTDPIRLIIHGNQTKSIPSSYKKYLSKALGKSLNLLATPVLIEFKNSDNPFKGKKNILSKRQINKRRRLIKYNKK